jgi:hypothetical protein
MLSLLTTMGVVFSSLFSTSIEGTTGTVTSMRALYIAEAGLQAGLGHLNKTPVSANWTWNSGYLDKAVGGGTVDVEVLQYEERDSTLVAATACEPFLLDLTAAGTNPARSVYVTLSWLGGANMGLELYDAAVADCANPALSATLIASSVTTAMPETVRYRITAPVAAYTYTARVTGSIGSAYQLRIAHPDETDFSAANTCAAPVAPPNTACRRALISLGQSGSSYREVFAAASR